MVAERCIFQTVEVIDTKQFLCVSDTLLCQDNCSVFLIDDKITAILLHFPFFIFLFRLCQLFGNLIRFMVIIKRSVCRTGDNQRCSRFINQNRIHFIDDNEVVRTLYFFTQVILHVVTKIVEPELIVRSVGNICIVLCFPLGIILNVIGNHTDAVPEKFVDASHIFGIPFGKIVVDGDKVHTLAGHRIEGNRQRCDERLTFTGFHLCNFTFMKYHTAHHLHIEVTHSGSPFTRFTRNGKRVVKHIIECFFTLFDRFPECCKGTFQFIIAHLLIFWLQCIDILDSFEVLFDHFIIFRAKHFSYD